MKKKVFNFKEWVLNEGKRPRIKTRKITAAQDIPQEERIPGKVIRKETPSRVGPVWSSEPDMSPRSPRPEYSTRKPPILTPPAVSLSLYPHNPNMVEGEVYTILCLRHIILEGQIKGIILTDDLYNKDTKTFTKNFPLEFFEHFDKNRQFTSSDLNHLKSKFDLGMIKTRELHFGDIFTAVFKEYFPDNDYFFFSKLVEKVDNINNHLKEPIMAGENYKEFAEEMNKKRGELTGLSKRQIHESAKFYNLTVPVRDKEHPVLLKVVPPYKKLEYIIVNPEITEYTIADSEGKAIPGAEILEIDIDNGFIYSKLAGFKGKREIGTIEDEYTGDSAISIMKITDQPIDEEEEIGKISKLLNNEIPLYIQQENLVPYYITPRKLMLILDDFFYAWVLEEFSQDPNIAKDQILKCLFDSIKYIMENPNDDFKEAVKISAEWHTYLKETGLIDEDARQPDPAINTHFSYTLNNWFVPENIVTKSQGTEPQKKWKGFMSLLKQAARNFDAEFGNQYR
jgi:hypothetical protein